MTTSSTCSTAKGYAVMFLGIGIGVSIFMTWDVQLALALIDPNDPSTWPDMGPEIRYLFIPVIAAQISVVACGVNWLLSLVDRREAGPLAYWVLLGASYGLVAATFPLRYLGVHIDDAFFASALVALMCAAWVRHRLGVTRSELAK